MDRGYDQAVVAKCSAQCPGACAACLSPGSWPTGQAASSVHDWAPCKQLAKRRRSSKHNEGVAVFVGSAAGLNGSAWTA